MDVKWIVIGEVGRTQGLRGELRLRPQTEFPERFAAMESLLLFDRDGHTLHGEYAVEAVRFQQDSVIVKLAGIDSINEAERLKGLLVQVQPEDLVPLPEGRHYIFELIGLKVITTEGQYLGTVEDVLQTGANDVYSVRPADPKRRQPILIPVIEDVVQDIDVEQGVITIQLMKGLLD